MTETQALPRSVPDSDGGLICGFALSRHNPPHDLEIDDIEAALTTSDTVTWLHFNLSNARARHLLSNAAFVPDDLKEVFRDYDLHRRVEALDAGLVMLSRSHVMPCAAREATGYRLQATGQSVDSDRIGLDWIGSRKLVPKNERDLLVEPTFFGLFWL